MNDDEMASNCTGLSLINLADGVRTLFKHKRRHEDTPRWPSREKSSPRLRENSPSVKFRHPVITSTHHRPMTEDDDIANLFFTEEEMDELEDDRYSTKFVDDVEVFAQGKSWDMPLFQLSTSSNLSIEEDYVPTKKQLPVKVGTVKNVSPRSKSMQALSRLIPRSRKRVCIDDEQNIDKLKLVKKVQIVLCEKTVR
jgi:hypothetical protein